MPPKHTSGTPIPMATAAVSISASLSTLTQATARTPPANTNPTSKTTATVIAVVRLMVSKLATETMMPMPVICSCTYGTNAAMPTRQTKAVR
jgi:hypothetical protein